MGKECDKCSVAFKGFGSTCKECRKGNKDAGGGAQHCSACGTFFMGFGHLCDQCTGKPTDFCAECYTTAYPVERVVAGGKTYHQACFKCWECGGKLMPSDFHTSQEGHNYCSTHFTRLKEFKGRASVFQKPPAAELEEQGGTVSVTSAGPAPVLWLSTGALGLCGASGVANRREQVRDALVMPLTRPPIKQATVEF